MSERAEPPVDVRIAVDQVGGPSAGMVFALGVVDLLTPGEMTGGKRFAGTGTIDSAGNVGAIGGIRQKLLGARAAGAECSSRRRPTAARCSGTCRTGCAWWPSRRWPRRAVPSRRSGRTRAGAAGLLLTAGPGGRWLAPRASESSPQRAVTAL